MGTRISSGARSPSVARAALVSLLAVAACTGDAGTAPSVGPSSQAARTPQPLANERAVAPDQDTASASAEPALAYPPDLPRAEGRATWLLYATFAEVVAEADIFIVGSVVSVGPGREAGQKYPLPTTVSEIKVSDTGKGSIAAETVIKVEQAGGVYQPVHAAEHAGLPIGELPPEAPAGAQPLDPGKPPSEMLLEIVDDPLFRPGERVVLALRWVDQFGVYRLVGPQGRFVVGSDGRVNPMLTDDAAVRSLAGRQASELVDLARSLPSN